LLYQSPFISKTKELKAIAIPQNIALIVLNTVCQSPISILGLIKRKNILQSFLEGESVPD
jgi:hypothetical protein